MPGLWRSQASRVQAVSVEVCWRPAQGEASGDFHDVIDLRDGRVVLLLGDAPASGAAAAELGEELRFEARRAAATTDRGPEILSRLDDRLTRRGDDAIATVVCVVLDPAKRRADVTNAGHIPILVTNGDGVHYLLDRVDPPLGVGNGRRSIGYDLREDSALFMLTDGLVERRGESLEDGLEAALRLADGLTGAAASAAELARRITDELGQPADDATAISVRIRSDDLPPVPPPARVALRVYLDHGDLLSARAERVVRDLVRRLRTVVEVEADFLDISRSAGAAEADGVMAAPTVVRILPGPRVRVVGGLRSPADLARALQLPDPEDTY